MAVASYESVLEMAEMLPAEQRARLIEELKQRIAARAAVKSTADSNKKHSIMELRGLGKEVWRDIDTTEYIRNERASWGGVERLHGEVVGLDSAPLIYFIEENPAYLHLVDPFFAAVVAGDIRVITSALTLTEVLNYPIKRNNQELAHRYVELLLDTQGLTTITVSTEIAIEAASLRANV